MFYGFGIDDEVIIRRLPPKMAEIVLEELRYDPSIASDISAILRSNDPINTIAREISAAAAAGLHGSPDFGLGKKSIFKRITKKVSDVAKKVQETAKDVGQKVQETVKKVAPYTSLPAAIATKTKFGRNVVEKVREAAKTYGPTVLKAGGAILAPFTGGASLSISALVQAREQLAAQKKAAERARRESSATAAQEQLAADAQGANLANQVDDYFYQNAQGFARYGITQDRWTQMTLDQKIETIDKIASGELQPIPITGQPYDGQPPSQQADSSSASPQGLYELFIEGQKAAESSTVDGISKQAFDLTKPGDRFEVLFNGQSMGMKVRTESGVADVAADQVGAVNAMSKERVEEVVSKSGKGGLPWWLIAIPVVGYVAAQK